VSESIEHAERNGVRVSAGLAIGAVGLVSSGAYLKRRKRARETALETEITEFIDETDQKVRTENIDDGLVTTALESARTELDAGNHDRARAIAELVDSFVPVFSRFREVERQIETFHRETSHDWATETQADTLFEDVDILLTDTSGLDTPVSPEQIERRIDDAREKLDEVEQLLERFEQLSLRASSVASSIDAFRQYTQDHPEATAEIEQLLNEAESTFNDIGATDDVATPDAIEAEIAAVEETLEEAEMAGRDSHHTHLYKFWSEDETLREEAVGSFQSLSTDRRKQALAFLSDRSKPLQNDETQRRSTARAVATLAKHNPEAFADVDMDVAGLLKLLVEQVEREPVAADAVDALASVAEETPTSLVDDVPAIATALNDNRDEVKIQVCRTLARIGTGDATARLRDARRETADYELRSEIEELIQQSEAQGRERAANPDTSQSGISQSDQLGNANDSSDNNASGELPKHEVLEAIGSGGNADVKKVRLIDSNEIVALKVPRWQGTLSESVIDEFSTEAATWARIDDHQHIIDVLGSGMTPYPWILLEYMPDGNLRTHLDQREFSSSETTNVLLALCGAIRHAHRHGIVHADLKPENVLFDGDTPKIGDWGLAKVLLEHSKSIEGMTPTYAAPEQLDPDQYGSVDDQTDVYQIGVMAYELLTGTVPYDRDNPAGTITAILSSDPTPPTEHNPELPPEIDDIVLTAMAKEKTDRYESVLYLRDALRDVDF
jgi:hypothetical protein